MSDARCHSYSFAGTHSRTQPGVPAMLSPPLPIAGGDEGGGAKQSGVGPRSGSVCQSPSPKTDHLS